MDPMIEIKRYVPEKGDLWDNFVKESRNGTFLFERGYMDYHSDRFEDCSWMVWKNGRLVMLFPANIDGEGILHSHQGLTYGGWILPSSHIDGGDILEIFKKAIVHWDNEGIKEVDYKPVPFIYSAQPSEEDIYSLFRLRAVETEVNLSSAINLSLPPIYNKLRRRTLKKALSIPYRILETDDVESFMDLTAGCLADRHGAVPVHTAQEMRLLKDRFPENIRIFVVNKEGADSPDAGVMVYDTGRVAHAQYIATTPTGREDNLLTPLFNHLIRDVFSDRAYFDFGISNEERGQYLNEGLLRQKFSYGATGVAYRRFRLIIR